MQTERNKTSIKKSNGWRKIPPFVAFFAGSITNFDFVSYIFVIIRSVLRFYDIIW